MVFIENCTLHTVQLEGGNFNNFNPRGSGNGVRSLIHPPGEGLSSVSAFQLLIFQSGCPELRTGCAEAGWAAACPGRSRRISRG